MSDKMCSVASSNGRSTQNVVAEWFLFVIIKCQELDSHCVFVVNMKNLGAPLLGIAHHLQPKLCDTLSCIVHTKEKRD